MAFDIKGIMVLISDPPQYEFKFSPSSPNHDLFNSGFGKMVLNYERVNEPRSMLIELGDCTDLDTVITIVGWGKIGDDGRSLSNLRDLKISIPMPLFGAVQLDFMRRINAKRKAQDEQSGSINP